MEEIRKFLHLDILTVTGKTLGKNLEELKQNSFYEHCRKNLPTLGVKASDIIKPVGSPIKTQGAIAILKGNLAPEGAVVKHAAISPKLMKATRYAYSTAKKRRSRLSSPSIFILERSYSSVMKGRRAAVCLKCFIQRRPSLLIPN